MPYIRKDKRGFASLVEKYRDPISGKWRERSLKYIGDPAALAVWKAKDERNTRQVDSHRGKGTRIIMPALPGKTYKTLVVDPPWPMEKILREVRPNQKEMDYPVMSLEQIMKEPIPKLAEDGCHIYLWTTQRFLPDAFRVLEAWGVRYIFTMVWNKPGGFQPYGLPQYNCEFCLFGKIGTLDFETTQGFFCSFTAARSDHSRKPPEFYQTVARVSPGLRLDMYSREAHDGFEQWGNEIGKFGV